MKVVGYKRKEDGKKGKMITADNESGQLQKNDVGKRKGNENSDQRNNQTI